MVALTRQISCLLCAALVACAAQARQLEYTESGTANHQFALGYAVPQPVMSAAPVNGFRTYQALDSRLQAIALGNGMVRAQVVGQTLAGRDIVAYVLSDGDGLTARADAPEPALMINGGIHAREWASPEVVAGLLERFDAHTGQGGMVDYLLDNTQIILIPVLNADGFVHTQRTPAHVLESTFTREDPPNRWPRDGRMRRKNMAGVDDDLATEGDGLLGIDLNRNNSPFWARSSGSSGAPQSIVYHGTAAASEPETRAMQAAAALGPADALHMYIDVHSFSRILFGSDTGRSRRDTVTRRLAGVIGGATSGYGYDPAPPGVGIGTTEEYFAYTYQIPAYTLEIEPGPNGAVEYGGNGVSHDGFILPDSEVARVRDELAGAMLLGLYAQAMPPHMVAMTVRDATGDVVFDGQWTADGAGRRVLAVSRASTLLVGARYTVALQFDRPMRVRDAGGAIAQYRGRNVPLSPTLRLAGVSADGQAFDLALPSTEAAWQQTGQVYADDRWQADITVPQDDRLSAPTLLAITVQAQDLSGAALDANPATVADWAAGWSGYEDGAGRERDVGGADRSMRLIDDGSPLFPTQATAPAGGGDGGSGVWRPVGLLVLLLGAGLVRTRACRRR